MGEMCLDNLPKGYLRTIIEAHPVLYRFGLQGPDIYFYYPFIVLRNGMKNLGSIMHDHGTQNYFRVSLDIARSTADEFDRECVYAYLAGFISHYILDAICHPYVYARIGYEKDGPGGKKVMKHGRLENNIDVILLKKYYGTFPGRHVPLKLTAYSADEKAALTSFMSDSVSQTYGAGENGLRYSLSRKSAGRILAFFRKEISIRPIPEKLSEPEEIVLNLDKHMWRNSWNIDITSRQSFPELFEWACQENMKAFEMLDTHLSYVAGQFRDDISFAGDSLQNKIIRADSLACGSRENLTDIAGTPGHQNKTENYISEITDSENMLLDYLGNRSYHSGLEV